MRASPSSAPALHGRSGIGCRCRVCTSAEPKNKRLRQSVKIEVKGKHFLIDTTPDLRLQLLRDPIPRLDFILYTHSHSDHLHGPRRHPSVQFPSARDDHRVRERARRPKRSGARSATSGTTRRSAEASRSSSCTKSTRRSRTTASRSSPSRRARRLDDPRLPHRRRSRTSPTRTASRRVDEAARRRSTVLALDGLRPAPPHPTHFTIGEADRASRKRSARATTYLIHLTHEVEHDEFEATLPRGGAVRRARLDRTDARMKDEG